VKLLVLASRFPWPLEKGDKLRIYHQLRLLSREHRIVLCALSRVDVSAGDKAAIASFCEEVHIFKIGKMDGAFALAKTTLSKRPWQVGLFYRKTIEQKIKGIARAWQPDRVFCQLTRVAPYAEALDFPVTFDFMDAFSVGMKRRADNSPWPASWVFAEESRRLLAYERKLLQRFDDCTIIAQPDADAIGKGIRIVPNGVDLDYFSPQNRRKEIQYDLVFVGNMSYYPNVQAASSLVKAIMPKLKEHVTVLLAGANPGLAVKNLASERVDVPGWFEDIRDAYSGGRIFVAPLFTGSGQQNKLLEAMGLGIPCITTPIVANGLGARAGEHLLVAGKIDTFAAAIERLLEDELLREQLSEAGRAFVEENFTWEHAVGKLLPN
jgi:sugar transferase (PEP-CTERM/EpsH1 system associated)